MAEFVDAIQADEVAPETACVVDIDGREIAIVNTGGTFFAIQNECTHAAYPLGEGDLVGEGIVEVVDGMVRVAIE
jgi:3-phenylpropionate/trans-cinnamate dioxygenase ferredoxin subunit